MTPKQLIQDILQSKKFGGFVDIEVIRDSGDGPKVIQRRRTHNLVVNTGKRQTWRQACGLNTNDWDQFRIGTSGVAANSAQTNVLSPVTGTLNTADSKTLLSGTRTYQHSRSRCVESKHFTGWIGTYARHLYPCEQDYR